MVQVSSLALNWTPRRDLRLAVYDEAEKAIVSLESGRVTPDRHVLLPQQSGQARQDL